MYTLLNGLSVKSFWTHHEGHYMKYIIFTPLCQQQELYINYHNTQLHNLQEEGSSLKFLIQTVQHHVCLE